MSSDEDDYMSDKFLQATPQEVLSHPLLNRNADKRALEILKRKNEIEEKLRQKKKSMKLVEQEKRDEGLNSAIPSDNKGFAMLAKMGYKPGQGIGKSETGISEPITINVKETKSGLGTETKIKEFRESMKKRAEECNPKDFRSRMSNKKSDQLMKFDFQKSQKICQQLDLEREIKTPKESWFWPKVEEKKKDDETDEEEEDKQSDEEVEEDLDQIKDHLESVTMYLRKEYCYCIWCAVKYKHDEDLTANCPGDSRSDH